MLSRQSKHFPPPTTIFDVILGSCRKAGDKIALVGAGGNAPKVTYRELTRAIPALAGGLKNLGLQKGDRVGLLAENSPRWAISYLGILAAGGTVVPLDNGWKETELLNVINLSDMKYLIASPKWVEKLGVLLPVHSISLILIGIEPGYSPGYDTLLQSDSYLNPDVTSDDRAALIYTSGTTGDPKGVILTHRNILANIEGVYRALSFEANDVFLSVLPLHHTFEATCGFLCPLFHELTVVYARSLKSRDILEDIRNHNVSCMIAVPLLYENVFKAISRRISELPSARRAYLHACYSLSRIAWPLGIMAGKVLFRPLRRKAGLETIRLFISGGAPLPKEIAAWFNIIGFTFLEGYGLTECSPVVTVNRDHSIRFGSVGIPLPNVEVAISESDKEGIGEIIVRGPANTVGYFNNPEATAALLRGDWLYTGDMGTIKKGQLYITGRRKNLIVSAAGKNIYPEEIESALLMSPAVLEVVVSGRKKDTRMGEEVVAEIVPNLEQIKADLGSNVDPSPGEVHRIIEREVAAVNNRLADYKRIKSFTVRTTEFEKTSTKKIKRSQTVRINPHA